MTWITDLIESGDRLLFVFQTDFTIFAEYSCNAKAEYSCYTMTGYSCYT